MSGSETESKEKTFDVTCVIDHKENIFTYAWHAGLTVHVF